MTKAELVKTLEEQAGLTTLAQAEAAYNKLFDLVADALKKGDTVAVSGFGSFKTVKRNPQTGKEIQIPASTTVKFTSAKAVTRPALSGQQWLVYRRVHERAIRRVILQTLGESKS